MAVRQKKVSLTTDSSGDASEVLPPVNGYLERIVYTKTNFADTVDFTITHEPTTEDLWNEDNVTASKTVLPRQATHDGVGAASLYAAAGEPVEDKIALCGEIKVVVANGGDTKSGVFHIFWKEN